MALVVIPSLLTKFIHLYDFEFVDTKYMQEDVYPLASIGLSKKVPVEVKVKLRH